MGIVTSSKRGDLIKGVDAKFADVFDQKKQMHQPQAGMLVSMVPNAAGTKRLHLTNVSGTGVPTYTPEGVDYAKKELLPGYELELVSRKYTQMVEVTEEAIDYNEWQAKTDEVAHMATALAEGKDRIAFNVLNNGFTTSASFTGGGFTSYHAHMGSGQPLFSTVHTLKQAGGTDSNASSNGAPLSEAALEDALQAITEQKADDGSAMPLPTFGRLTLFVPPSLRRKATEYAGSELSPSSGNNNINFFKGLDIDVVTSVYLGSAFGGSDTQWFMGIPQAGSLVMATHTDIQSSPLERDRDNNNFLFKSRMDLSAGWRDWRYFYGSKGDNAAYAS